VVLRKYLTSGRDGKDRDRLLIAFHPVRIGRARSCLFRQYLCRVIDIELVLVLQCVDNSQGQLVNDFIDAKTCKCFQVFSFQLFEILLIASPPDWTATALKLPG